MIINKQQKQKFLLPLKRNGVGSTGIGIGNRVLNGMIVFDFEDLLSMKEKYPDNNAILVRPTPSR